MALSTFVFATAVLLGQNAPPVQFAGNDVLGKIVAKAKADAWHKQPVAKIMGRVAQELTGTPYVGWTLERSEDREYCFVTLQGLDCVTFFESTLGLARIIRAQRSSPKDLIREVTHTRYRGGVVGDYLSRLHYTSDWMHDNVQKGTVTDLTVTLPGMQKFQKSIFFMSDHVEVYRQLKAHPEMLGRLANIEAEISARSKHFVPKANVAEAERRFQTGDIIGITTTTPGMDCSHTGMIVVVDGVPRFMHASSAKKKVMLDGRLSEYLASQKSATGFMAVRPSDLAR